MTFRALGRWDRDILTFGYRDFGTLERCDRDFEALGHLSFGVLGHWDIEAFVK